MKRSLEQKFGQPISGELLLKKTAIANLRLNQSARWDL